uniref:Putative secreted protein n=2 Tax=Ixodes ricinus TaxID=34613 RepID=V5ID49_IXORI
MIRMMILSLSAVLLATSGYIHANQCNIGLANYMNTKCPNTKFKFHSLSECSFSCQGVNSQGQPTITTYYLVNGLPCGPCKIRARLHTSQERDQGACAKSGRSNVATGASRAQLEPFVDATSTFKSPSNAATEDARLSSTVLKTR